VETGGCPHTAIREDASINLEAVDRMLSKFPNADIVFIESGGDNLAATFSLKLSDLTIYVIDVAAGEKIRARAAPASPRATSSSSQDRPRTLRRRRSRGDGGRHQAHARRQALRDDEPQDAHRPGGCRGIIERKGLLKA